MTRENELKAQIKQEKENLKFTREYIKELQAYLKAEQSK